MRLFAQPTADEWLFIGIVFFLITMLIIAAELVRRLMHGNSEITRKFVHVVTGILMAFAPGVFTSGIPAILISLLAIIATFLSIRFNLLQSLHDTERISYGTTFHPLAFLILVLTLWDHYPQILSIAILILAVPDALAAIVGKSLQTPHYFSFSTDKKTVEGSAVMFASTSLFILAFLANGNYGTPYPWIVIAVATALVVTVWELICTHGLDNFTIPLSSAFMLHYFLAPEPHHIPEQMLIALLLAGAIGLVSHRFHFLSPSGSLATFLLAVIVYGIGGWMWTLPILTFFIASSLLSKLGKSRKKSLEGIFDKTDKRDAGQVAANGGLAGLLVMLWYFFPDRYELYFYFLGSVAAVTADTWGTELGTLLKGKPRSIVTFRSVEVGTSGGVSIAGILGGAFGAALVMVSSLIFGPEPLSVHVMTSIIAAGIIGSLVDSLLGATLQAQYCTDTGRLTEKRSVNGVPTKLVRGFHWINNDVVNWMCAAAGVLTMYFLL
jgi:uncharacterized protein (TIGR00297 family)